MASLFLLLIFFCTTVYADGFLPQTVQADVSGIPTAAMFYTAYKLDFLARGSTGTFAQVCATEAERKMCNFAEWLSKYIRTDRYLEMRLP